MPINVVSDELSSRQKHKQRRLIGLVAALGMVFSWGLTSADGGASATNFANAAKPANASLIADAAAQLAAKPGVQQVKQAEQPSLGELAGCVDPSVVKPDGSVFSADFTQASYVPGPIDNQQGWRSPGALYNTNPISRSVIVAANGPNAPQHLELVEDGKFEAVLRPSNENCKTQYSGIEITGRAAEDLLTGYSNIYASVRQQECEPPEYDPTMSVPCTATLAFGIYKNNSARLKFNLGYPADATHPNSGRSQPIIASGSLLQPFDGTHSYLIDLFANEVAEGIKVSARILDRTAGMVMYATDEMVLATDANYARLKNAGSAGVWSGGVSALYVTSVKTGVAIPAAQNIYLVAPTGDIAEAVPSESFTVTPDGLLDGWVVLSDNGAGGQFVPQRLRFENSRLPQTFTYVPAAGSAGTHVTIKALATNISGTPISNVATVPTNGVAVQVEARNSATGFAFTAPAGIMLGGKAVVSVTPNGQYDGTVALTATGGGSFNPPSLTFTKWDNTLTSVYTAPSSVSNNTAITLEATDAVNSFSSSTQTTVYTNSGSAGANCLYELVGPTKIVVGQPATYTLYLCHVSSTPTANEILFSLHSSAGSGQFSSDTVVLPVGATNPETTFTYTPTSVGDRTIYVTRVGAQSAGASLAVTAKTLAAQKFVITGSDLIDLGAPADFTIIPDAPYQGKVTLSDGNAGGIFTPAVIDFTDQDLSKSFTYAPVQRGVFDLSSEAIPAVISDANHRVSVPAANYTLVGPSSSKVGEPVSFRFTPDGPWSGRVSLSETGANGQFSPAELVYNGQATASIFTYTPAAAGTAQLELSLSAATGWGNIAGPTTQDLTVREQTVAASGFTVIGPEQVARNQPGTFRVVPDGSYTGTVTVAVTGGGSLSETSLQFTSGDSGKEFTYTPISTGSKTLIVTAVGLSSSVVNLPVIVPAENLILSGPSTVPAGQVGRYSLTVDGPWTGQIALDDSASAGSFSTSMITFTGLGGTVDFTYTPTQPGRINLSAVVWAGSPLAVAPLVVTVPATSYTLEWAEQDGEITSGQTANLQVNLNGPYTGEISLTSSDPDGVFTVDGQRLNAGDPAVLQFTNGYSETVAFTPSAPGLWMFSGASAPGLINAFTSLTVAANSMPVDGPDQWIYRGIGQVFSFAPNGPYAGTISLTSVDPDIDTTANPGADTSAGIWEPPTLTFSTSDTVKTAVFKPSAPVNAILGATVTSGNSINVVSKSVSVLAPLSFANRLILTGPTTVESNQNGAYTLTPNGFYTGKATVTVSGGGSLTLDAGSVDPNQDQTVLELDFDGTGSTGNGVDQAQQFVFTPNGGGLKSISVTALDNTYNDSQTHPKPSMELPDRLDVTVPATSYQLQNSSGTTMPVDNVPVGQSINLTAVVDGVYAGTVGLSDGGGLGALEPVLLSFDATHLSRQFTYTPAKAGQHVIVGQSINPTLPDAALTVISPANGFNVTGNKTTLSRGQTASFSVYANGPYTGGSLTVDDGNAGGQFTLGDGSSSQNNLTYAADAPAATFMYKANQTGRITITVTDAAKQISGSIVVTVKATEYELTCPTTIIAGQAANCTVKPDGPWTGQITLISQKASITPQIVSFLDSDAPQQVSVLVDQPGLVSLDAASEPKLGTSEGAATITVTPAPVSPSPTGPTDSTPGPTDSPSVSASPSIPPTSTPPPPVSSAPVTPPPSSAPASTPPSPSSTPPAPVEPPVQSIRAPISKLTVKKGATVKLPVLLDPVNLKSPASGNATVNLTWSNVKAAKVTASGLKAAGVGKGTLQSAVTGKAITISIKGLAVGKSSLTVTAGGKKLVVSITVAKKVKAVTKVTVKGTKTAKAGKTAVYKATAKPANAGSAVPIWSAKPGKLVKIDAAGKATMLKKGKASITVKIGKKKATIKLTIK
jgi:hypothetical protein